MGLIGDQNRKEKGGIYMVFPYMDHDLAGLLDNPKVRLTQPQIKTYLKQLLEGTAYLHHVKFHPRVCHSKKLNCSCVEPDSSS